MMQGTGQHSNGRSGRTARARRYGSTLVAVTLPALAASGIAAMVFAGGEDRGAEALDLATRADLIRQAAGLEVTPTAISAAEPVGAALAERLQPAPTDL
ncbi:MAG: hypothetical protein KI785_09625 [Devosiaceae bacterium]|nr:hypothetical protein [Devosiaceae bacterium MH13]